MIVRNIVLTTKRTVHGPSIAIRSTGYFGLPAGPASPCEYRRDDPRRDHDWRAAQLASVPELETLVFNRTRHGSRRFDPLLRPGASNYWKSHDFSELSDGAIDCVVTFAGQLPSVQCELFVGLIGGAPNRVPAEAMAYGHRDARSVMNVQGRWDDR
jgi:hypothetical protein